MSYLGISDPARRAYASLAPHYDRFTADFPYEHWLTQIEARALALGLDGRRVLDLGCGTGNGFAPLLARGYRVSACDLSPEMVHEARRKFAGRVEDLFVADMRELPPLGTFDLVTCLVDAIDYLLFPEDLEGAFRSVAGVLAPRGIFVFDVNSLKAYRTAGTQTFVREDAGALFCWRGEGVAPVEAGDVVSTTIEAFIEGDDSLWRRFSSRHVQRHHPPASIQEALEAAGLQCIGVAGQRLGGHLEDHADEADHTKLVYFARRRRCAEEVS